MARRADALIPLSWDHHHGLNLARTITATLDGDERFGSPSPAEMAAMVAAKWSSELTGHFEDEEDVLAGLGDSETVGPLLARMRAEHVVIAERVAAVAAAEAIDAEELVEALRGFAAALTAHVRFEERELFPAVESELDETELRALGMALVTRREADGRSSEREAKVVRGALLE